MFYADSGTSRNYDIVSAAQTAIALAAQKGLIFEYRYVPGHQDCGPTVLDVWESLNVRCDSAAVRRRQSHSSSSVAPVSRCLFGEGPVLVAQGKRVIKQAAQVLRRQLSLRRMRPYFETKRVPQAGFESVSLDCLEHAMLRVPLSRRIWISKLFYGFGPTGRNMFCRQHWESANCPRCGAHEDLLHVITCPSETALAIRRDWLSAFPRSLRDWHTSPTLRRALVSSLTSWLTGTSPTGGQFPGVIDACLAAQEQIGWYQTVLGMWSPRWQQAQEDWIRRSNSRGTSRTWLSRIMRSLWDLVHSLWMDRNECLHSGLQLVEHTALAARIRRLYALPRSSFPCRFIPLQELLSRPLSSLQAWLEAYDTYYSMYTGRPPGAQRDSRRRHSDLDPQFDPELQRRQREARHARAMASVRHYRLHLASRLGQS